MQVLTYQKLSTWRDSWASCSWRVLAKGCFETRHMPDPTNLSGKRSSPPGSVVGNRGASCSQLPHTLLLISLTRPSSDVSFAARHDLVQIKTTYSWLQNQRNAKSEGGWANKLTVQLLTVCNKANTWLQLPMNLLTGQCHYCWGCLGWLWPKRSPGGQGVPETPVSAN